MSVTALFGISHPRVHGLCVLPSANMPSRQLQRLSGTVRPSQFGHRHHWLTAVYADFLWLPF